ncbi:succinate dehydrogenase/fumarate reductase flavoprotein subunit [Branchiibius hedensis]|uniref:Succinate dehydrogenase/fumarate reductase, flavoprotein subunit n=1 Tax=Branchiibius hedensis TaxID=672460 RepID=A0A2Y8ZNY3_9MICO|nr:FAD-dependent oxidoreductase [Branchiibius hedensis]PWJ24211.1 succinate dehydrogenase/fumarate reductase flavoprotein subunit [Branchiibius hedensis]SSA33028.1 Succinate dehydrogenase/fumarate reductase, flavoprotein subunit [Branchiibius hedensis]
MTDAAMLSEQGPVEAFDEVVDVLVVGSGAGGLAAAVTAADSGCSVMVAEKADRCGGATGRSGGWMWTPGTSFAKADGVDEDPLDGPRTYLEQRLGEQFDASRVEAYLRAAPRMVDFFQQRTHLTFTPGSWIHDIYGDTPGAGTGHRSVGPDPIDTNTLPERVRSILPKQLWETSFLGMGIMAGPDLQGFLRAAQRDPRGLWHATKRTTRHLLDLTLHRESRHLVNGAALIARLLASADDLGVDVRVNTAVRSLIRDSSGAIRGAVLESPRGTVTVGARRAVVLAAGGFPADVRRRVEFFPHGTGADHHTLAPATDTGDGLRMGTWAGGDLDTSVASPVAWCPVSLVPHRGRADGVFPHIMDRGKPGIIGVTADGRRFVNEANGYHDYVLGMLRATPEGQPVESWLIADHRAQRRYPLGMSKPFPVPVWPYLRSGYLQRADTLEELAEKCGIDGAQLAKTVQQFNEEAARGQDPEYGRGTTAFNRYSGDPTVRPNPTLAVLDRPPYYAVKVLPGSFGTFLGLRADERSRVLSADGSVIPGLYAVGTDQGSVFGGHYPSGASTSGRRWFSDI